MKAAQAPGEEAPGGARSVKVVLVGDGGCGKTSLLMVFAEGAFPEVSVAPGRLLPPEEGGTGTRPASRQSLGSKAALTVPPGVKDSVASSVKCQERHLPGGGVWGRTWASWGRCGS